MKLNHIYKSLALALVTGFSLTNCTPNIDSPAITKGSADFSKYVAIGNSLTAGFADGGVYREAQINSYPNIIANQLKMVNGSLNFRQPLFAEAQANGSGYLKLTGFANGSPTIRPETTRLGIVGLGDDRRTPLYAKAEGVVDNLGVPGIRMSDIKTNGYGFNNALGFNPYFQRLLPNTPPAALQSYLQYLQAYYATEKPTFFTCWLGNNDVLGYATSGGVTPITPTATFQSLYRELMGVVTTGGAKGIVATVPNITSIPYLNTVTYTAVRANVPAAKAGFEAGVRAALGGTIPPQLQAVINSTMDDVYIRLANGTVTKATTADLFILTATDSIGSTKNRISVPGVPVPLPFPKGFSSLNPLDHPSVLDRNEVATAVAAVTAFNNAIKAEAATAKVPVFDAEALLNEFRTGKTYNGLTLGSGFITGGIFSLDGVHATQRGYAIMANEFIKIANSTYGATIPQVDITKYPGVIVKQ
jgi:lysophospholipase L1-like esterase